MWFYLARVGQGKGMSRAGDLRRLRGGWAGDRDNLYGRGTQRWRRPCSWSTVGNRDRDRDKGAGWA